MSALGKKRTNARVVSCPLCAISGGCYQHPKFDEHGVTDPRNVNFGGLAMLRVTMSKPVITKIDVTVPVNAGRTFKVELASA
jgi:hypothetical protein